jgi:peptidyl-prolyl cis-trans isomerase C
VKILGGNLTYYYSLSHKNLNGSVSILSALFAVFLLMFVAMGLSACGSKDEVAGQALVRVNGEEITILQLNDELRRAGMKTGTGEVDNKKLLESLIDRQLLTEEGINNNIDRTPEVVQSIQRAKAQIIADAYLELIVNKISPPTEDEINEYYQAHPEYFAQRKQFDMDQLIVATKDLNEEFMKIISNSKTLNEVAAWLDKHHVHYARGQLSRSSADLTEPVVAKLKVMKKGQIFIVNQGDNSLLSSLTNVKDSPVTAQDAAPQIKQYLINSKSKEAVAAELARLRSLAKIEYLNAPARTAP